MSKLEKIIKDKSSDLTLVLDFDKTLTCGIVNGTEVPSLTSILRSENHLDDDYTRRASILADHYRPIENDPNLDRDTKSKEMHDWWSKHYELKIEKKLNISHIKSAVNSELLKLRPYAKELLKICYQKNIKVIILSANGLGIESIRFTLEKELCLHDNIEIISNVMMWDESGTIKGYQEPIIHSQNKNNILTKSDLSKNVILVGDGLHDSEMVNSSDAENVYKIGIYEHKDNANLNRYKEAFDEVWSDNISFEPLVKVLEQIK